MTHKTVSMENVRGFLAWAAIGAGTVIVKAGIGPILILALLTGIINQLGKRLADPMADYMEARLKGTRAKFVITLLRKKKNKPKN